MCFNKSISLNNQDPDAYFNLGNSLFEMKKLSEAKDAFIKGILIDINNPIYYNNLGHVYVELK